MILFSRILNTRVDSCKENRGIVQTDVTPLSVRRDAEMLGRHRHVLAMSCVINLTLLDGVISRPVATVCQTGSGGG